MNMIGIAFGLLLSFMTAVAQDWKGRQAVAAVNTCADYAEAVAGVGPKPWPAGSLLEVSFDKCYVAALERIAWEEVAWKPARQRRRHEELAAIALAEAGYDPGPVSVRNFLAEIDALPDDERREALRKLWAFGRPEGPQ